jgi:shikimate 5-dehydrogenase
MWFIGVSTAHSSIMRVYPAWARHLGLPEQIAGVDCRIHDRPEVYRAVVERIKQDPICRGALVTSHKIDLLDGARELFDELDSYAELLGEVSCLSKRAGRLIGHAKDPVSGGLALESFVARDHFRGTGGEVCILGAGGSSLALVAYLLRQRAQDPPPRITITNRSVSRLERAKAICGRMGSGVPLRYVHAPSAAENDAAIAALPAASLVVNATGLGKDAPGSPCSDAVSFPPRAAVWDFNYRGELGFLHQAELQRKRKSLLVEDGWRYFVHGWTRAIAEVFRVEIPSTGPAFAELERIADEARTD